MVIELLLVMSAQSVASDCWVKFYDRQRMRGRALIYTEAGQISDFEQVEEDRRVGKYDSLVVGPDAKLIVWERSRFRGDTMTLGPGTRVEDIDDTELGEIGSFKIACRRTVEDVEDEPIEDDEPVDSEDNPQEPVDPIEDEIDEVDEDTDEDSGEESHRPQTRGELDTYVAHLNRVRCGEFRFAGRVYVEFTEYQDGWRIKAMRRISRSLALDMLLNDEYFTPRDRQIVDRTIATSNFNGLKAGDYMFIEKLPTNSEVYMRLQNQLIITRDLSHIMFNRVTQDIYDNRRIRFSNCR